MKVLFVAIFHICMLSSSHAQSIEGKWRVKTITSTDSSANFDVAALAALNSLPQYITITKDSMYFTNLSGASLETHSYQLKGNIITVSDANKTLDGTYVLRKKKLKLRIAGTSYKLIKD